MITLYVDTETSGLDPKKHQILTMACEAVIPGEESIVREFQFGLLPDSEIVPQALEVNKLSKEAIESFPPCKQTFGEFIKFIAGLKQQGGHGSKLTFAAYNARFDFDMLRGLFERCGGNFINSYFWFPPIDIMNTAVEAVGDDRAKLPNFKLSTVAKHLGIALIEGELHGALYDIQLAKQVREKALQMIKERV